MNGQEISNGVLMAVVLAASPWVGRLVIDLTDWIEHSDQAVWGPSPCKHCGADPVLWDRFPIVPFLQQRGRARCCGAPLGPALIGTELTALVLTIWAALITGGAEFLISALLGWVLLALAVIDYRTLRLPDPGTLGLVLTGLAVSAAGLSGPMLSHAAGAVLGFLAFALIGWVWHRWRGIEALGLGDAKLLGAAGAWLGVMALPSVVLIGCAAGLALALGKCARRGKVEGPVAIPFGPALALGFWITWLHGPIAL